MPIHTVAYSSTSGLNININANTFPLRASRDPAVTLSAQYNPIFSQEMFVVAGFALHPDLDSVQINAPTLRKIVSPYVVPFITDSYIPSDPNAMCLLPSPWGVGRQEEVGITVTTEVAYDELGGYDPQVLLWLADRLEPVPQGPNYWVRYRRNDDDVSFSVAAWTTIDIEFEQTLAAGRYAVIGFQHQCDGLLCARLIFDKQVFRPATIAVPLRRQSYGAPQQSGARTHSMFYDGSLGVLGYFDSYAPPQIEVMMLNNSNPSDMNNSDHVGYLRIVRVDG